MFHYSVSFPCTVTCAASPGWLDDVVGRPPPGCRRHEALRRRRRQPRGRLAGGSQCVRGAKEWGSTGRGSSKSGRLLCFVVVLFSVLCVFVACVFSRESAMSNSTSRFLNKITISREKIVISSEKTLKIRQPPLTPPASVSRSPT